MKRVGDLILTWPPCETKRVPLALYPNGNRYRRCRQCHTWFSRKTKSMCPCGHAVFRSRECHKLGTGLPTSYITRHVSGRNTSSEGTLEALREVGYKWTWDGYSNVVVEHSARMQQVPAKAMRQQSSKNARKRWCRKGPSRTQMSQMYKSPPLREKEF